MIKTRIAVIDSGIGGLNLLKLLDENLSQTTFYYLGDNDNAPYGNKSIPKLWSITMENLAYLRTLNLDYLILGCNTLSVNLLHEIEDFIGVKTIGVFPPVEKGCMLGDKTLLISTISTAKNYTESVSLTPLGLFSLASDIERNVFNLDRINLNKHIPLKNYPPSHFNTVILGCTHYDFIKKEIFDHLKPQNIISGIDFTLLKVVKELENKKSLVNSNQNEVFFIGKNFLLNEKIYFKVVKNIKKL